MSELNKEIIINKAAVPAVDSKKEEREELAKHIMDSISGGWVNAFARWSKSF